MVKDISRAQYVITGHNREAPDRVTHFVRIQSTDGMPVPGAAMGTGPIITDDAGILADGTVVEIATVYEVVAQ